MTTLPAHTDRLSSSTEPVSLSRLKAQLRLFHNEEDSYLQFLISVARQTVEEATNRVFAESEFSAYFEESSGKVQIYGGDVLSATIAGQPVTIQRNVQGATIEITSATPFEVIYTAGKTNPMAEMCILLLAAHLYENRLPVGEKLEQIPYSLEKFISILRIPCMSR